MSRDFLYISLITTFGLVTGCGDPISSKNGTDGFIAAGDNQNSQNTDINNSQFPNCGNDKVDKIDGEECDGDNLNGLTCLTLEQGYSAGTLSCTDACHFNTSKCTFAAEQCIGIGDYPTGLNLNDKLPCNFHTDCASGNCASYKLDANDPTLEAHYCGAENQPTSTALPNISNLGNNYPCNFNSECKSGYCWHGPGINICTEVCDGETVTVGPFSCLADEESPTGSSCLPNNHNGEGATCRVGAFDCANGLLCILGYCTKKCDADAQCKSGYCLDGPTSIETVCVVNQLIFSVPIGGECYDDIHCQSERCESGICVSQNLPDCRGPKLYPIDHEIADGYPCNIDTDCTSGECNTNYICGPFGTVKKQASNLPLHYPCEADNDCASHLCVNYDKDLSICGQPCTEGATGNGYFECSKQYGSIWACTRNKIGAGNNGDSCKSTAYDCGKFLICEDGRCVDE